MKYGLWVTDNPSREELSNRFFLITVAWKDDETNVDSIIVLLSCSRQGKAVQTGHNHEEDRILAIIRTCFDLTIIGSVARPEYARNPALLAKVIQQLIALIAMAADMGIG
uniref:Uncharacterized protein n=1 Tax=Glossina pallidipes TaxID=7398 RepID=A0A1A9ZMG8_GLOPL